jgi:hypothetical protein
MLRLLLFLLLLQMKLSLLLLHLLLLLVLLLLCWLALMTVSCLCCAYGSTGSNLDRPTQAPFLLNTSRGAVQRLVVMMLSFVTAA